ncbi:MAG TPA: hypothetical protein VGE41_12280 [Verrucomicrobiae bacterium]|jgi:hypothetical protein
MKTVLYSFILLAACGLVLSFAAHCMALAGVSIPGGVWVLHVGIFVVWIPTILASRQMTRYANRKDFWKVVLAGCPIWMRRAFYVLFVYATLNFIVFFATTLRQPKQQKGDAPPSVIRGFSGHWMVFYSAAFAILYSRIRAPQLYREHKCPQGHAVSPAARYCSECGYDFSNESAKA